MQASIKRSLWITLALTFVFGTAVPVSADSFPAPFVGDDFSGIPCRGNPIGYGPFDYLQRANHKHDLFLVEGAHFTPSVENLIRGHRSGDSPLGDINYTLRAFPNHHRALYSAVRLRMNEKSYNFTDIKRFIPAECWLQRAVNFSPSDPTVYMLYGILLHKKNHNKQALEKYESALKLKPNDLQTQYNYALLLVDLNQHGKALEYAEAIYAGKFPLEGLKNKLIKSGHWAQKR